MRVLTFFMFCLSANLCSWAFKVSERCQKTSAPKLTTPANNDNMRESAIDNSTRKSPNHKGITYSNKIQISDVVKNQKIQLEKKYKNYEFQSIPMRGHQYRQGNSTMLNLYSSYNCSFTTHNARTLSSVVCDNLQCKLGHTVSTEDSYTSFEGGMWNGKLSLSTKFWFVEVGAELTHEESYSCTYTKGKTTTETVECELSTGKPGNLILYLVKSDMMCNIGKVTMKKDLRNGTFESYSKDGKGTLFNTKDIDEIKESAHIKINCVPRAKTPLGEKDCDLLDTYLIDFVKISDRMQDKLKQTFPYYNPYSDTISILYETPLVVKVTYYQKASTERDRRIIVPFTNEDGDSIFQFACIFSPI